jgi:uncharacterized protein YgbK (DUF1537 family)
MVMTTQRQIDNYKRRARILELKSEKMAKKKEEMTIDAINSIDQISTIYLTLGMFERQLVSKNLQEINSNSFFID